MKRPVKEWLETIADKEIREAAISQIDENWIGWPEDGMVEDLIKALFHFNDWGDTKEKYSHWANIWDDAKKGQLETREAPKMKEGYIPYSNEQERQWAIAQAKKMGATESELNEDYRRRTDNCIAIEKAGYWRDTVVNMVRNNIALIPLERPEEKEEWGMAQGWIDRCDNVKEKAIKILEKQERELKENYDAFTYAWNSNKYTKTEQEDGTIILKPKTPTYYVRIYQDHQGQVKTQIFNTPIQSDGSDKVVEFKPLRP